ncbi:MAG: hypothetical protein AMXMBFR33_03090 [Candidatus Xenobia bacterium]
MRSSRLYRTFLPFLLALLGWLARISMEGALSPLEAYPYDTALKYLIQQEQGAKIILAGIDDETHRQGKFNRLAHAQFLINMREHGARVVFLDLLFDNPRDEEMDAALTEAVNETGLAVLACALGLQTVKTETGDSKINQRGTLIESLEESLAAGRALPGLINCYNDPTDQKIRTAALAIQSPDLDRPWPAAALAIYARLHQLNLHDIKYDAVNHVILAPPASIPVSVHDTEDSTRYMLPIYYLPRATGPDLSPSRRAMPVIPYHELIDPDSPTLKAVKDAVVIVGDNTDGDTDLYPTPVGPMKGFEIHAQILNTLLTGPYARPLPDWVQGLVSYLLNLAIAMAILRSRSKWTAMFSAVALLGVLLGVYGALFRLGWQTGIAGTIGGYLTTLMLATTARLLLTAQVLQRFIPPEVVSAVMAAGSAKPRNEIATIIVTDIRGYTTLSESRTPVQILKLLNEYHSVTVAIYEKHGGRALTYQGDAQIIAFLQRKGRNQTAAAIRAAYEMQKAVDILRERWGIFNQSEFDVGAAVCTGPLTIGEIGTTGSGRAEYTVIGETVRLAHKIQSLSQVLRCNVLMDEASFHASKLSMHAEEFKNRQLEGVEIPVTLYGLRSLVVPGKKSGVRLGLER